MTVPANFGKIFAMMPLNILSFCDRNTVQKIKVLSKCSFKVTHAPHVDNIQQQLIREQFVLNRLDELEWICHIQFGSDKEVENLCIEGEGQIPECISEFKYLKDLTILEYGQIRCYDGTFNRSGVIMKGFKSGITGIIPKEIGLLQELESLNIRGNLVSYLPKSMKMMTKLNILKLTSNIILGEIPHEFFEGETGPLRFPHSVIHIWKHQQLRSCGSILHLPIKQRVSPYSKRCKDDPDDECLSWIAPPVLMRSNAITLHRYWWGTIWE